MTDTTTTAREYLRVSYDGSGRERSNDEQTAENRATFPELAFNGSAYSDVGSASRFATKVRGDFDQLVSDLERDRFGADVLVLWEGSRGSRRVGVWVSLIELLEDKAKRVAITMSERIYDPANPNDRRELIAMANDAEYESAKTSKRSLRAARASAAAGRPNGRVPFGYRRTYEPTPKGPRLLGQEPNPDEAPIVVELFDRLRRGHSLKSIARDFEARGIRGRPSPHGDRCEPGCDKHHPDGVVMSAAHLRTMAVRRLYVGERTHKGSGGKVEVHKASWPPLVDRATFEAVRRTLTDPSRLAGRPGRARHFLSGIVPCGECGGRLVVEHRGGRLVYRCFDRRHLQVGRDELDDLAERVIVAYLADPKRAEALTADDGNDAEQARARDDLATARADLDDLADKVGRGELSATLAARSEPQILGRIRAGEARVAELSTPSALRSLITPGDDVAQRWAAASIEVRRKIARIVLSPELVGELRVVKAPRGTPVQDRVTWRRG